VHVFLAPMGVDSQTYRTPDSTFYSHGHKILTGPACGERRVEPKRDKS